MGSILSSPELNTINASSLTSGFAYNVCCVLTLLVDCVLLSEHFSVKACVYDSALQPDDTSNPLSDEIEEEAEPLHRLEKGSRTGIVSDKDDDLEDFEDDNHDLQSISDVYQSSFVSQGGITALPIGSFLFGSPIDPALWKEETERVGRALASKQGALSQSALNATEWSGRIQMLKSYAELNAVVEPVKNGNYSRTSSSNSLRDLTTSVNQLKGSLCAVLQTMGAYEKALNTQYGESVLQYSHVMAVGFF